MFAEPGLDPARDPSDRANADQQLAAADPRARSRARSLLFMRALERDLPRRFGFGVLAFERSAPARRDVRGDAGAS